MILSQAQFDVIIGHVRTDAAAKGHVQLLETWVGVVLQVACMDCGATATINVSGATPDAPVDMLTVGHTAKTAPLLAYQCEVQRDHRGGLRLATPARS